MDHIDAIRDKGFSLVPQVVNAGERLALAELLGSIPGAGRRGLMALPAIRQLACSQPVLDLVRPHMSAEPFPVRAIYFDKAPGKNWLVTWHQDLTLALQAPVETPGFGPWSTKDGVPHVQPPAECLEQMLTVRIHLDDADEANGALRVLPGSHRYGRLTAEQIQSMRTSQEDALCQAAAGDALLMRPLILHASGRSTSARHRRVLHIEYAAFDLPAGLMWHEAA